MKKRLTGLLFLIVGSEYTLAQKGDTIAAIIPLTPTPQFRDSLCLNRDKMKFSSVIPDYTNSKGHPRSFTGNQMTLELETFRRKTTVFDASYSKFIVPAAMVSFGVFARKSAWLQELDYRTSYEMGERNGYLAFVDACKCTNIEKNNRSRMSGRLKFSLFPIRTYGYCLYRGDKNENYTSVFLFIQFFSVAFCKANSTYLLSF